MTVLRTIFRQTAGTACLAVVGVAALLAMNSCTGGCSRTETAETGTVEAPVDADDPTVILDTPVAFDERTLAEYADKVTGDTLLSDTENARLIVVTEAAVNRLSQIVDALEHNDDPADTWNVMEELCTKRWPGDIAVTTAYLRRAPLDGVARDRANDIDKAIDDIVLISHKVTRGLKDVADLEWKIRNPEK